MPTHYDRLPHDWRHLPDSDLAALIPGLSDADADMVDCEIASRPTPADVTTKVA